MQQLSIAHQEALLKVESLNSVPVEEQEEFKQLTDDIQELQQSLNQEFRQKTIVLQEGNSHKKSAIAEKTKRLQEVMEKYETYRDSVDCLPSCQLEVQLYQKKIQDLADNKDKLASALKESLNLEDQIESAESELRKLKTEESSLRRLLIAKKEKLATTQFRINKKHEDIKQYKRAVIEDCNKVQEKRGAVYEQVTTINQEIQKIKFGMQQLKDATGREKLKSHEIFLNLRTALDKYHEGIEKATEECCTRIEEKAAELKGRMFRAST
ncbi:Kinetochore protein Nuf2 [Sciurus carolinensis]|uniref:Kinetochore protein Nuf2 n=2 Tax=Sciurus carolinensis TaxID=30640 RepID=A0AA41MLN3_SCICA|nr:Kinetochore protein Nuf2 [Sciurus carolinensis]